MKQFLVHFDDSPRAVERLQLTRRLATAHSGMVTALYAVTPALLSVPFAAEAGPGAVAALRELDDERLARAKAAFDQAIEATSGVRAHWSQVDGYPVVPSFAEQALYADLVVFGQHDTAGTDAAGVPPDLIESVVVGAGRPALIVPFTGAARTDAQDIAIAWKPTREAAHAVRAAEPLLRKARSVHVLAWGDDESGDAVRGSKLDLTGWLRQRGIEARFHRESGPEPDFVGEMLLTRTFDLDCDLLVMGCYGHGRAREFVFGGASRTVLQSMTLPVLMSH